MTVLLTSALVSPFTHNAASFTSSHLHRLLKPVNKPLGFGRGHFKLKHSPKGTGKNKIKTIGLNLVTHSVQIQQTSLRTHIS